jgi:limonene-1,2-epoxide hydrolase
MTEPLFSNKAVAPPSVAAAQAAVTGLLTAIESRDLRAIRRTLSENVTWQNVPHPAARGRDAVISHLANIITWSDEVRWEIVSASYGERHAWVERIDRFLLDHTWYAVQCNGVIEVDNTGLVTGVRDYVDLGEWRSRVQPVLDALANRSPIVVVQRHLDAVRHGDAVAMAADYAADAVLVRGHDRFVGWDAIADYFDGVPDRLGERAVTFGNVTTTPNGEVLAQWTIAASAATTPYIGAVSGIDTFVVAGGRIVHQTVSLLGNDF